MTPLAACLLLACTLPPDDPACARCACVRAAAECRTLDRACSVQRNASADSLRAVMGRGACLRAVRCHRALWGRCTVLQAAGVG